MSDLAWMAAPLVACLVAMAALGWFGFHVLERGVIFVDLALAQIAALGGTWALFLGLEVDAPAAMALSLLFTLLGSAAFAALRQFDAKVPQEALIGISYAVSAGLGVLLVELADDPHGAEKVQHLLVGNIVWVQWSEIAVAAAAVAAVGLLHALGGRRLLAISADPEGERGRGTSLAAWDLFFYASFGVVLTAIVGMLGVLMVFSLLVVPAVVMRLFTARTAPRLLGGWAIGGGVSLLGVAASYEHATGPIVVTILGGVLVLALAAASLHGAAAPGRQAVRLAAIALGVGGLLGATTALAPRDEEDGHHHIDEATADHEHAVHHADHADHADAAAPGDPFAALEAAVRATRGGDPGGLTALAALTRAEAPFIRIEADSRLRQIAGSESPDFDPLAGPDSAGLWHRWATSPPAGWQDAARTLAAP